MNSEPKPRQLEASCVIGAVFLPKLGSLSGTHARDRVQKDPSNLLPATFYHKADQNLISQRLGGVPQSSGGLMPEVNLEIGAPKATFAYAAISYDEPHPNLNLIKAAQVSRIDPSLTYDINLNKQRANLSQTVGDGTQAPASPPETLSFPSPQYPFIPSVKTAKFSGETVKTTYNIWKQISNQDEAALNKQLDYLIYYGVTNYIEKGFVHLNTNIDATGGSAITVHCQGQSTVLERMFPIADDLVYEPNTKLFYPDAGVKAVPPETIKARGGENCGFWLHFDHSDIPPQTKPDGSKGTGGIIINWGAPNGGREHRISNFSMVLVPGQTPKLYYKRPSGVNSPTGSNVVDGNGEVWIEFPLSGAIFGNGTFDVFIHYVGPNMLIGFDSDTNGWNAFTPQSFSQSYDTYYEPHTPADSRISIVFSNTMVTFTYSPICFNNYHPENMVDGNEHRGFVNVNFTVPISEEAFASESSINSDFQSHRSPPTIFTDNQKTQPTIYGDWRRKVGDAELLYQQLSSSKIGTEPDQDIYSQGKVFYDTTIEGPQFMHIRNFRPDDAARDKTHVVRPVWKGKGDISDYLISYNVSTDMTGENSSILQSTAEVKLKNIANTEIGAQIVNAVSSNIMTVTLSAGWSGGKKETFFQGVIDNVALDHGSEGTEMILNCRDIGTALLTDIRFSHSLNFTGQPILGTIKDVIEMSGLGDWFRIRPQRTDAPDRFYAALTRNLALLSYQGALVNSNKFGYANKRKHISDVLYPVMKTILAPNIVPALYWNPTSGTLNLDERGELTLDDLYFVGGNNPSNIHLLPNSFADREHGVIMDKWQEITDVSTLHSSLDIVGNYFYGGIMTRSKRFPEALGEAAFAALDNLVGGSDAQPNLGYTGFNKRFFYDALQDQLGSENAMNELSNNLVDIIRTTYTKLTFDIYVTRPLTHMGKFRIISLLGGSDPYITSEYYYKKVEYNINIDANIITAQVEGERFPRFISP